MKENLISEELKFKIISYLSKLLELFTDERNNYFEINENLSVSNNRIIVFVIVNNDLYSRLVSKINKIETKSNIDFITEQLIFFLKDNSITKKIDISIGVANYE